MEVRLFPTTDGTLQIMKSDGGQLLEKIHLAGKRLKSNPQNENSLLLMDNNEVLYSFFVGEDYDPIIIWDYDNEEYIECPGIQQLADAIGRLFNKGGASGAGLGYREFIGLINQSGSDSQDWFTNFDNGYLVIGATYEIANYDTGDDFTNIGAPSNANGVKFVATGHTAVNWNGATQLIYNPGAPIATVLENTIGNIWLTFDSDGEYFINSNGLFLEGKSWTPTIQIFNDSAELRNGEICEIRRINSNQYKISTFDQSGTSINGELNNTPIEIRVYD